MVEITASCSRGSQRVFLPSCCRIGSRRRNTYIDDFFFFACVCVTVRGRSVCSVVKSIFPSFLFFPSVLHLGKPFSLPPPAIHHPFILTTLLHLATHFLRRNSLRNVLYILRNVTPTRGHPSNYLLFASLSLPPPFLLPFASFLH